MGSKIEKNKNELLLPRAGDDRRCGLLETSAHAAGRGKGSKQPKKPIFSCSGERGFEKLFNETDICGGMDLNRWTNEIYEFQVA